MNISIMILEYLKKRDISPAHLARLMGESKQGENRKLTKNTSQNSDFIESVSKALNHDFFEDLSNQFRKENNIQSSASVTIASEPPSVYHTERERNLKTQYDQLLQENLELHRELRKLYKELKN